MTEYFDNKAEHFGAPGAGGEKSHGADCLAIFKTDCMTKEQTFQFLLEGISTDIIGWLMRDYKFSLQEAISTWYNSQTFEKISEPLTGMYIESPAYNYKYLKEELSVGHFPA